MRNVTIFTTITTNSMLTKLKFCNFCRLDDYSFDNKSN